MTRSTEVRHLLLCLTLVATSGFSVVARGQDLAADEASATVAGLRFVFKSDQTVAEFLQSNRVVIGGWDLQQQHDDHWIVSLHYPGYNDAPGPRTYMVTDLKLEKPAKDYFDFDGLGSEVVLMLKENGRYEIVGFAADVEPDDPKAWTYDEQLAPLANRSRFFKDPKYRYEKFLSNTLKSLDSDDPSDVARALGLLAESGQVGKDALPKLREMMLSPDPGVYQGAFRAVVAIGGPAEIAMLAPEFKERLQKRLAEGQPEQLSSDLYILGQLGEHGANYMPILLKRAHQLASDDAGALVHQCMRTGAAIDRTDPDYFKLLERLADHPTYGATARHFIKQVREER